MKRYILTLMLTFSTMVLFAQPLPPGRPDDGGAGSHDDTQMPVGTGTLLLLGLGSAYVIIKKRKNRDDKA